MLSFSHVENKKLLWQTIQRSPLFQKTNVNWTWFQTIFHEMVQINGYETHTIAELVKINETVIRYMIQLMQVGNSSATPTILQNQDSDKKQYKEGVVYTRPDTFDKALEKSLKQRQQTYQELLQGPIPPNIDFHLEEEFVLDSQNIDILLEKHKLQREKDLQTYPSLSDFVETSPKITNEHTSKDKVRFEKDKSHIVEYNENESPKVFGQTISLEKRVLFLEQQIHDMKITLEQLHPHSLHTMKRSASF